MTKARPIHAIGQVSVDTMLVLTEPLNRNDHTTCDIISTIGGSAAIVAHNAAILGGNVSLSGHFGQEQADKTGRQQLEAAGVQINATTAGSGGLRISVIVEPSGERTMIANKPSVNWASLHPTFNADEIVYFEGWHLADPRSRSDYLALIASARRAGATIAIDVCTATPTGSGNDELAEVFAKCGADVLFANETEAAHYGLLERELAPLIVVHRGAGSTLVVQASQLDELPLKPVSAMDTTGAGDTFAAGFLTALAIGADPFQAVEAAHDAARQVLATPGGLLRKESATHNAIKPPTGGQLDASTSAEGSLHENHNTHLPTTNRNPATV